LRPPLGAPCLKHIAFETNGATFLFCRYSDNKSDLLPP
jgi:hypothetical protein